MRNDIKDIKKRARDLLPGNYLALVIAAMLPSLIVTIVETPFSNRIYNGLYSGSMAAIIIGYAGIILISTLRSLCDAGSSHMHLEAADHRRAVVADLIFAFKNRPDRYIGYYFLIQAISIICMIPALIPGTIVLRTASFAIYSEDAESYTWAQIIEAARANAQMAVILTGILAAAGLIAYIVISLAISQTTYVLIEDSDIKVIQAVKYSMNIMKGNKWALFKLYVSYIGWLILVAASLGLVSIWMLPYFRQAKAQFYRELVRPVYDNTYDAGYDYQSQPY